MTFEELSRQFEKLWVDLCEDGEQDPLACAGIMMAQAMRIYKSMLTENEFNIMVETILKSRPEIISIEKVPPALSTTITSGVAFFNEPP